MSDIEIVAATLQALAEPGMKRKELIAAVRERHPKTSKKDIVRAAFYALTSAVKGDVERAHRLQDFALHERIAEDAEAPLPVTRRKKDRRKDAQRSQQPVH
ncbi:MAG: hypothetical protein K2X54_18245 [Methylobacterium organophilum]|nr:hypothetical protein [Methylobacterium organophilum]